MSDLKAIRLTTGGYGTAGFTFSVFSNATGNTELTREQYQDPYFDKDYNNQPFVAGVVYRFLGYHPDHMADEELIRVVFKETGGYEFLDPDENNTAPPSSITDWFSDSNSNALERDAVFRAMVASFKPETWALLAKNVVENLGPLEFQYICAGLSSVGCGGGGNGKILAYIRIEGVSSFPKNQTRTYQVRGYYTDGTNAIVTGALFSIQGEDITIGETTGLVTPGPNAVVGGPYTISASYLGRSYSKGITLTAAAIAYTRRNVPPRFFEPVGLLGPNYDGSLDSVTCDKITGWIADVNHPNTPAQARLFINGILAATVTATQPRSDVTTYLNLANTNGHIYGFEFAVPNSFRNGSPLVVELKPVSGSNAMRYSPKTSDQGCLDLSNLINVAAQKTATATSFDVYPASHLTDEDNGTITTSLCMGELDPYVLTIDLNGTAKAQQVKITPRAGLPGGIPVAYIIDGSLNGVDGWFRMVTVNNQARGEDEIILPVERDVNGNYRDVRYVRLTTNKNGTTGEVEGCYRVQFAELKVMAPSLTPIGEEPPTRQPSQLLIQGDNALSEGTYKDYIVSLQYTNGDIENVTSTANLSVTGIAVSVALVDGKMRLTAADDGTTTVVRTATLKATVPGLQATKDVSVYNSTVSDYIVNFRIDWNAAVQNLTEGTTNTVKVTAVKASGATEQYTGAGAYSIIAPYPNGMTLTTGANAIGTLTLPGNSITANLNITIRFTFPAGNGVIEKVIQLINVNDTPVTFTGYEIAGDATLAESATQSVSKNYVVNSVYSDGSRVPYTGAGSFSADTPFPDGMSVTTPGNGTGLLTLLSNSITGDVPITLRFTFPDNGTITKVVTLLNVNSPTPTPKILEIKRKYDPADNGITYYVKTQLTGLLSGRYRLQERHNPSNFDTSGSGFSQWQSTSMGMVDGDNSEYNNGAPATGQSVRFEFRIFDTETNQVYSGQDILGFDFVVPASATAIVTLYPTS